MVKSAATVKSAAIMVKIAATVVEAFDHGGSPRNGHNRRNR